MDKKENIEIGRRGFIYMMSGLFSGLLLASPARLMAAKTTARNLLSDLEIEVLEKSRPTRNPSITLKVSGDKTTLYRRVGGKTRPIGTMNQAGKIIWEGCNGKNTPQDIAELVHQRYLVSFHQAHVDCLAFLTYLRTMGAIRL